MQTFKHKNLAYYTRIEANCSEWVSFNGGCASVAFNSFSILPSEDYIQCPESEYLQAREQAMYYLNDNRPKIVGASKYLNQVVSPQTAE